MTSQPFASLDAAITEAATAAELSSLALGLAARLVSLAAKVAAPEGDGLLTADEAAAIAKIRRRTLYSWSREKAWAVRPEGSNTLLVKESSFRKWLEKKRAPKPRRASASTRKARGRD